MNYRRYLTEEINDLTSELLTCRSQSEMLTNTLNDILARGTEWVRKNSSGVEKIKRAVDSTNKRIDVLYSQIEEKEDELSRLSKVKLTEFNKIDDTDKVEYSFYDSVKKQDDDESSEDEVGTDTTNEFTKGYLAKLNQSVDDRIHSNRFLVCVEDVLGVPDTMVKSVTYNLPSNTLVLTIYDFITTIGGSKYPIIEQLSSIRDTFDFEIKHVDAAGNTKYNEKYEKCRIYNIQKSSLDYHVSDFSTIKILISYDKVLYDTSE